MKIGIVAPPWVPVPPPRYGGTEKIVDLLARGFSAAGHEVLLWTTGDSTCPVPRGHVLATAATDRIGVSAVELHHLIRGYEALVEWGADIVHDHTLIGPVHAASWPDLPVVTTNHGPFNEELADLYRAVGSRVPVIAISHDQARRAGDLPIAAVIHHGLDLGRFPVGDGMGDERGPYFAFLARMTPEKGARHAALTAREAGTRLLMAAKMREPQEQRYFAEQVQPLLDDRIEYIGEVGHDEKVRILGAATALLNPIRWPEPFGLAMIESLACGTPVLTFEEGSAPELVQHGTTGFVCHDIGDLTAHMKDAENLDRKRCRRSTEERFSTERMVAGHLRLFEHVLEQRERRAA